MWVSPTPSLSLSLSPCSSLCASDVSTSVSENAKHGSAPDLEVLSGAGDGAAGADASNEVVNLAVGALPDLGAGGGVVDGGVGGVLKLLEDVRVGGGGRDLLGLHDGSLHALGGVRQDEVGAEGAQQDAALEGHGGRHGEDELVALGGGHEGEGDAGVSARGLHEGRLWGTGRGESRSSGPKAAAEALPPAACVRGTRRIAAYLSGANLALDLGIGDHAVSDPAWSVQRGSVPAEEGSSGECRSSAGVPSRLGGGGGASAAPVLDGAAGLHGLELSDDVADAPLGDAVQVHHRGVACGNGAAAARGHERVCQLPGGAGGSCLEASEECFRHGLQ